MDYDTLSDIRQALAAGDRDALARQLAALHTADLADVVERLEPEERDALFATLDDEAAAGVLHELDESVAASIVRALPPERASDLLEDLPADAAADVLQDLPDEAADALLAGMDAEEAQDVRELLEYPENTAGGRMVSEFATIGVAMRVDQVIASLRANPPAAGTSYYLYVCDSHGRLAGVVSLRDLIIARPDAVVGDIMARDVISVRADADQEAAAEMVAHYDLLALPVVDDQGRMVGVVTVDDIMEVLEEEATEDILHLSSGSEDVGEGAGSAMRARLPRTALALVAGLVAAALVAAWRRPPHVTFFLFVPLALAVSEVVTAQVVAAVRGVMRRDAPAARLGRSVAREVGLTAGTAAAVAGLTMLLMGRLQHLGAAAGTLGLALFLVAVVASMVGALVPVLSRAAGKDPAVVPVSLTAAVSDTAALVVYLWVVGR